MPAPKKEPMDAVKGGLRALEQLEAMIPGFSGYKAKELRREADKLLRETLAEELEGLGAVIDEVYADITGAKMTAVYGDMNTVAALMDKVIARIESADYGYAGFFDAVKIREEALDEIYAFDKALFAEVDALSAKADELAAAVDAGDAKVTAEKAKALRHAVNEFDGKLGKRNAVMLRLV